jgi:ABC-type antimicrobial peptide transport system permease subunit
MALALRSAIREADTGLVPDRIATLERRIAGLVARPRLYAILLGTFAASALVVAGVGLFGVLSFTIGQRSRELAVRAALGAHPGALIRMVLAQGLVITAAGLGVGLLVSMGLAPSIRSLLYGVTSHDAFTLIAVPIVVSGVAAVACIGPARRAGRLDPIKELRA